MAVCTEPQHDVIAFLSRPESHGQPPGTPVDTVRTHASYVFLCGDSALKLKRAVRYSYLDYSTPERRRDACAAELALNRRIAPELYLDVRAIGRGADGGVGWGRGEPVDWVVAMRRFPDAALFDSMAERGALTAGLMAQLTEVIAAFHAQAEVSREHGGQQAIGRLIADNVVNLAKAGFDAARIDALRGAQQTALAGLGALLDRRRDAGLVRQCHGDLHLGNICLYGGRPTLFDAIEFDPAIFTIDVLYDLAFLLMDLRHRGLDDFANQVFNRYLDILWDDGISTLPLFMSLRATIRAHVSRAAGRAAAAMEYFALAGTLLAPVPPRLVAVGGLSGTGKSTLAAALAPRLGVAPGARMLRSDVMRKRLFNVAPTTRLPPEAYDEATARRVFQALADEAVAALRAGHSVVVDAVAARPEQRRAFADVARSAGVPFTGFWLEAPQAALEARIAARRGDASDATVEVLRSQLGYELGSIDWIRLDAAGDRAATAAEARRLLARPGPAPR